MSNPSSENLLPDPFTRTDTERRVMAEDALWTTLGTLFSWRRFITLITGAAAILAVVLSLMMDNWYMAETRLLIPTTSGGGILSAAIMKNLPTSARSLLGSGSSDYFRYLSIMSSHTMFAKVVDTFDLVTVYETADAEHPRDEAISILKENATFNIDDEYDYLYVQVYDTDPQRAADMANFFIEELNEMNGALSSQTARNFREYVEKRYDSAQAGLDSVLVHLRVFQEKYGILNLEAQGEQFIKYLADIRVETLRLEGEYEVLLSQFGPDNSQVRTARVAAQSANRKYEQALEGKEKFMPVPQKALPGVAQEYIELERERLILTTLLEYIYPVLEEARMEEERKVEAVQVVDKAVAPSRKAKPKRSVIVIISTFTAFLLTVLFVLVYTWWQRNHVYFARKLQQATETPASSSR